MPQPTALPDAVHLEAVLAALGGSFGRARSLGERCGGLTAACLERA